MAGQADPVNHVMSKLKNKEIQLMKTDLKGTINTALSLPKR